MSKKHTNYQSMYDNKVKHVAEEETAPLVEATEVAEEVKEEVKEEVVEVKEEKKPEVIGVVTCEKLNIRKVPNGAKVCEVVKGTEMMIDESNSTHDWYAISTVSGIEGFCMKKFVSIK